MALNSLNIQPASGLRVGATIKAGATFRHNGLRYRVAYVNESRAHCVAREPREVTLRGRTFLAHTERTLDISPNTDLETLQALQGVRA